MIRIATQTVDVSATRVFQIIDPEADVGSGFVIGWIMPEYRDWLADVLSTPKPIDADGIEDLERVTNEQATEIHRLKTILDASGIDYSEGTGTHA